MFVPTRYEISVGYFSHVHLQYLFSGHIQVHQINHPSKPLLVFWLHHSINFETYSTSFQIRNDHLSKSRIITVYSKTSLVSSDFCPSDIVNKLFLTDHSTFQKMLHITVISIENLSVNGIWLRFCLVAYRKDLDVRSWTIWKTILWQYWWILIRYLLYTSV